MLRQPQVTVGAVLLYKNKILLIKRANTPGKGLWSVPGGRVKLGESLENAVKREVLEETQLDCEVGQLCFHWEFIDDDFHYVILDFVCRPKSNLYKVGSDALRAQWCGLAQTKQLGLAAGMKELLQHLEKHKLIVDSE